MVAVKNAAYVTILHSAIVLLGCSSHSTEGKDEAVRMARDMVIQSSGNARGHIPIFDNALLVTDVSKSPDGGWSVRLAQGDCVYFVYAHPGKEIDVTGVSEGCYQK